MLERAGSSKHKKALWLCRCDCGEQKIIVGADMVNGRTKSCGCLQAEQGYIHPPPIRQVIELRDKRFGRLLAIKKIGKTRHGYTWLCQCDCGNKGIVLGKSLRDGNTQSCGCIQKEVAAEMRTGKNHPHWKGGISFVEYRRRKAPKYLRWRKAVLERDNNTCLRCNSKCRSMCAHHIYGFAEYKLHRYKIDNGITLCKRCHDEFHKLYGYTEITKHKTAEYVSGQKRLSLVVA